MLELKSKRPAVNRPPEFETQPVRRAFSDSKYTQLGVKVNPRQAAEGTTMQPVHISHVLVEVAINCLIRSARKGRP